MRVIWSYFASETLKEIFEYYKKVAGEAVARRIIKSIFLATKQLKKYPDSGQIEETLRKLNEGHRYLIKNNYKIIYKRVKEEILITDVFDTRQDPSKMDDPERSAIK